MSILMALIARNRTGADGIQMTRIATIAADHLSTILNKMTFDLAIAAELLDLTSVISMTHHVTTTTLLTVLFGRVTKITTLFTDASATVGVNVTLASAATTAGKTAALDRVTQLLAPGTRIFGAVTSSMTKLFALATVELKTLLAKMSGSFAVSADPNIGLATLHLMTATMASGTLLQLRTHLNVMSLLLAVVTAQVARHDFALKIRNETFFFSFSHNTMTIL